jgi:lactate 2-monooxygenase
MSKYSGPTADEAAPFDYQQEVYKKGLRYERPPISFDPDIWEKKFKEILPQNAYNYAHGNAGTGQSDVNNITAFRRWAFLPKRLTGQTKFPDLSVKLFGKTYPYPIALCPVGFQRIFHPGGEMATSAAANEERIPYIFSSASATSIEEVAKANGSGERWFKLYWPSQHHQDVTASLLSRAQNHGYDVLVVNVDSFIMGWRPCDQDDGYSSFLRPDHVGVEIGLTDPVYREMFKRQFGKEVEEDLALASATWSKIFIPGYPHKWEDLATLREQWRGPMVVKGIQTDEDAEACVKAGMDGVYVSNHGGRYASFIDHPEIIVLTPRQLDAGVGSLDTLADHLRQRCAERDRRR